MRPRRAAAAAKAAEVEEKEREERLQQQMAQQQRVRGVGKSGRRRAAESKKKRSVPSSSGNVSKRGRAAGGKAGKEENEDDEAGDNDGKERVRGGYKCSKCGLPKKGHVCVYQPKLRRRANLNGEVMNGIRSGNGDVGGGAGGEFTDPDEPFSTANAAVQVELDAHMVVRELPLHLQGTVESYQLDHQETAQVNERLLLPTPFETLAHIASIHRLLCFSLLLI